MQLAALQALIWTIALTICPVLSADAMGSTTHSESLRDAWWTGPLLAPSAATLPHGHIYIESYMYDRSPDGHGCGLCL